MKKALNVQTAAPTSPVIEQEARVPAKELTRHLTQLELARRWSISPRTLERWRWLEQGPCYLRIGGRKIVYRLEDIESFESASRHEIQVKKLRRA